MNPQESQHMAHITQVITHCPITQVFSEIQDPVLLIRLKTICIILSYKP